MTDETTRLTTDDAINHTGGPSVTPTEKPFFKKYGKHILIAVGVLLVLGVVIGLILGLTLSAKLIDQPLIVLSIAIFVYLTLTSNFKASPQSLANAVKPPNIMKHLRAFYDIAMANKGSRAVLEGYDASLDYVRRTLQEKTGCEISTDPFFVPNWYENKIPTLSFSSTSLAGSLQRTTDFLPHRFAGNGTFNINAPISVAQNYGCQSSDYGVPGTVAMTFYANNASLDCSPYMKALAAQAAGAAALIIGNNQARTSIVPPRILGPGMWSPKDPMVYSMPVVTVSYFAGQTLRQLASSQQTFLNLQTDTTIIVHQTNNLYCVTKTGDSSKRIVVGAHLDSVPAGPGINDNGSGSASLLEMAIQFYKLKFKPVNQVMFAWWGAEELGLYGSRYFVNNTQTTNPQLWSTIKAGINFDMLASPNGIPEVQTIDYRPSFQFPASTYAGSRKITQIFEGFYKDNEIPFSPNGFTGGSDYQSFAEAGVPAGGLGTGAGSLVSVEERTKFTGPQRSLIANAAYDPCYHQACDTVDNINQLLMGQMASAGAFTMANLAMQQDIVNFLNN